MTTDRTRVITAIATRRGTRDHNADGAAVFTAADLTTAAAVVDGIGNSARIATCTDLLAEVAARVAARRGGLAGVLSAGELVADPGADDEPEPDGVAVVAVASPGDDTIVNWVGDCRAYGWDGAELRQYTTDHTVGQQLRVNRVPVELAEAHDNWVRSTLSRAVVALVYEVVIPDGLVLLTSDGVPDGVPHDELVALVREHGDEPQALVDAIVAAAREDEDGYRDDATVVVLRTG